MSDQYQVSTKHGPLSGVTIKTSKKGAVTCEIHYGDHRKAMQMPPPLKFNGEEAAKGFATTIRCFDPTAKVEPFGA